SNGKIYTAGSLHQMMKVGDKKGVHCIWHGDSNPSAFIKKINENALFMACSSCGEKGFYNAKTYKPNNNNNQDTKEVVIPSIDKQEILSNISCDDENIFNVIDIVSQHMPKLTFQDISHVKMEHYLTNILNNCIFPLGKIDGLIHLYVNGYWKTINNISNLRYFIQKCICSSAGKKMVGIAPLIDRIKDELLDEFLSEYDFRDQIIINLKSKCLKITHDSIESIPHDLKYRFTYKLPYDYDPDIDTTNAMEYFENVIEEKEAVLALFEFLGSCLIPKSIINLEKALMLVGYGSNGKSTLLNLIRETLGSKNISSVMLHEINNDNKIGITTGKLLNIATELNPQKLDTAKLKIFISREKLSFDRKYLPSVETDNFPINICATNELPNSGSDSSYGFLRRFMIINFNKLFSYEEVEEDFEESLLQERPAVLKLILEGAIRLLKNRKLTESKKITDASVELKKMNNSVFSFLTDCKLEKTQQDEKEKFITGNRIYDFYLEYCRQLNIPAKNKRTLYQVLRSHGFAEYKSGNNRGWLISINEPVLFQKLPPKKPNLFD
ncbi:MAG: phage/plasmid primase, P4 family, partial [Gammaproteobacteria bacterium]|nr:phage/plasmid primase, P4 family [Gammaproteobacteria bacterium]